MDNEMILLAIVIVEFLIDVIWSFKYYKLVVKNTNQFNEWLIIYRRNEELENYIIKQSETINSICDIISNKQQQYNNNDEMLSAINAELYEFYIYEKKEI